jgi:hypothetical protein
MAGIAHGMKPRRGGGPSKALAEEFVHATPPSDRSRWSKKKRRTHSLAKKLKM